jgi:LGFP repeat-containing protein
MKSIKSMSLIATLILLTTGMQQVVAQAPPKVADQIVLKAREFKLGSPRSESPAPRQTPSPRSQGWWQAFEGGWVYWSPDNWAHVVGGKIFEAWGRQGWEQGPLAFPKDDEEVCRAPDSRDRYQRFEGGVIYWRATTNEATIYNNDAQNGLTFAVNGVCSPTLAAVQAPATTAPAETLEVAPNISEPAPGPPPKPEVKPPPSASDPARGLYRITILDFRVEHVVHDGVLDAGDDAFVMWDAQEFSADGRLVGNPRSGQSLVYGDSGRNRAQIQAGSQGENGGIRAGDKISGRSAPSLNRLPMLVGDFELVDRANAFVFAPTIWVANDQVGDNARLYRQRLQSRTRFAAYDVRQFIENNSAQFHWNYSLSRGGADWFDMRFYSGLTIREDRPIGSALAFYNCPEISGIQIFDFIPHTFLLTYKSVTDFMQSAGGQREVTFDAHYRDSGRAVYTLMMAIERVK